MRAYVDSSVVLRTLFHQDGRWIGWDEGHRLVSCALTRVECFRVLDRVRLLGEASEKGLAALQAELMTMLGGMEMVEVSPGILQRAGEPMPAVLGTLDAIHLATARAVMERETGEFVLATHDQALAKAARLLMIKVVGDA